MSDIPRQRSPIVLGEPCHAIGAWPITDIEGSRLGLDQNGGRL